MNKVKLHDIIEQNKPNYSLMVATAYYEVKAYAPQIPCLLDIYRAMNEMNIPFTYIQLCGDSYPCRAKNSLVHKFLKSEYSHLMIIDSDETWTTEGFLRLLRASISGCEVVAGLYPCKNNWEFFGGYPKMNEDGALMGKEVDDMRLIEMMIVPGGFVIYSREAFERTRPILDSYFSAETCEHILEAFKINMEIDGLERKTLEELEIMDKQELINLVLANQPGGRKGTRIGEDVYFMSRYRKMGGKIYCEPNIDMGHWGVKQWEGNYHKHLMKSRGLSA